MNDLLANIPGDGRGTEQNNEYRMDIEAGGPHATSSTDADMADFFREVAEIKDAMSEIRKKLQKLQEAHEESKTVTKAEGMKALKQRMESDVDEVSKKARTIKSKLEALDKANMVNRKKPGCGEGSSADRARMSMTVSLKRKLKDLMSEFQMLRQRFHDEYREVVERRIFTVTGKRADEETIEQLIETGDSESIFQKAIKEQGRGQILETVAEIQERHDAVRELEKKLLDLHQIFLDMAVLVEEQGEMLDNIENQVSKAVDHVQAGTDALHKAKKSQRSKRKWMCFAIVLLLIIIVIIVVAVIQPWKSKSA